MDRFLIACILSATIVSYYTTPSDVISKLCIIPTGVIGVMFPAFSAEYSRDKERAKFLYLQSIKHISLLLFVPILCVILFAKTGLTIWLSPEFAEKGYRIAQLMAIGIFLYGINQSSQALIQACGRSDITAKIDIVELPVYLISLFFFIKYYGLLGAAIATVIRYILDSILLHYCALRIMRD